LEKDFDEPNDENKFKSDDNNEKETSKFEEMMRRWNIDQPEGNSSSDSLFDLIQKDPFRTIDKWCKQKYSRPMEAMLSVLGGNNPKEAATCLFWHCYYHHKDYFDDTETVEDIADMWEETVTKCKANHEKDQEWEQFIKTYRYIMDISTDLKTIKRELLNENGLNMANIKLPDKPYVDVMLAATQAILVCCGNQDCDTYTQKVLFDAFQIIRKGQIKEAENYAGEMSKDISGFISIIACGIVCNTYVEATWESTRDYDRDFISSFIAHVEAMRFNTADDRFTIIFPFKDSSYDRPNRYYLRVVDIWEEIKKHPAKVTSWDEILIELDRLDYAICEVDQDETCSCGSNEEPWFVYFPAQKEFCKSQLSQEDFIAQVKREQNNQHEKRMKTDFLGDLWEYLDDKSKERLNSAEFKWYEGPHRRSCVKAAIEDYSAALEIELHSLIFNDDNIRKWLSELLNQKTQDCLKVRLRLSFKNIDSLTLNDMAKLLASVNDAKYAKELTPLKSLIDRFPISGSEKEFLHSIDFTSLIKCVYRVRNKQVHEKVQTVDIKDIADIRKRILGIYVDAPRTIEHIKVDGSGYLAKLLQIKKSIVDSNRSK
jgi:hypothetical protein